MNVGQILETHLGWACSELGDQISDYLKEFEKKFEDINNKLIQIYGKEYFDKVIKKLSKKEIFELIQNISKGLQISTHLFQV